MTPNIWDLLKKGLDVYDNRERLQFQNELAMINANNEATLRAAQLQQNVDAVYSTALQDTLRDAVTVRNLALLSVAAVLGFILVRGV